MKRPAIPTGRFTEIGTADRHHSTVESTDPVWHSPADDLPDPFDGHDPWVAHPDVAGWRPGGDPA